MRIAIVGAGIVGVTSAYELAADGHEVTVFERSRSIATGASFANAGVIAPGFIGPWASPGMPLKVLGSLFDQHSALRFGGNWLDTVPWLWKSLLACRTARYQTNRTRMLRLAQYSQQQTEALTASLRMDFERSKGFLVLLRTPRELKRSEPGLAVLRGLGVNHEVLDANRARQSEPGLAPETPLHAAIRLPQDSVGNCRQFAQLLRLHAQARGVSFRMGTVVQGLAAGPAAGAAVTLAVRPAESRQPPQTENFDAVVLCAGARAATLLGRVGVHLPILPVYGYSVSAPLRHFEGHPDAGPRSGVMDEQYKVAISRLGQRIRVAGIAEIGGHAQRIDSRAMDTLYKVLDDWFPGIVDLRHVQQWKGARPMLPDGPPIIGPSGHKGLWLNVGHGSSGWAMACGSARVLADQIGGRAPAVDVSGFSLARLG